MPHFLFRQRPAIDPEVVDGAVERIYPEPADTLEPPLLMDIILLLVFRMEYMRPL